MYIQFQEIILEFIYKHTLNSMSILNSYKIEAGASLIVLLSDKEGNVTTVFERIHQVDYLYWQRVFLSLYHTSGEYQVIALLLHILYLLVSRKTINSMEGEI